MSLKERGRKKVIKTPSLVLSFYISLHIFLFAKYEKNYVLGYVFNVLGNGYN